MRGQRAERPPIPRLELVGAAEPIAPRRPGHLTRQQYIAAGRRVRAELKVLANEVHPRRINFVYLDANSVERAPKARDLPSLPTGVALVRHRVGVALVSQRVVQRL